MSDGLIIGISIIGGIAGMAVVFLLLRRFFNPGQLLLRVPLPQEILRYVELERMLRETEFKSMKDTFDAKEKDFQQTIEGLRRDVEQLEGTVKWLWGKQNGSKAPPPPQIVQLEIVKAPGKVLGIWPNNSDLEIRQEIDSIAASGIAYVPMTGGATKRSVLEAISRDKPSILHVGAHAGPDGIELDDGLATVGWWRNVVRRSPFLRLVVLNACTTLAIVDALRDAGVPAVVGMRGDIGEKVSIDFVRDFYAGLMRGATVGEAAEVATLSLTLPTDAEMIVARDPDGWTFAKG